MLTALAPERVLPFGSGDSRKRGPGRVWDGESLAHDRGGAPEGERSSYRIAATSGAWFSGRGYLGLWCAVRRSASLVKGAKETPRFRLRQSHYNAVTTAQRKRAARTGKRVIRCGTPPDIGITVPAQSRADDPGGTRVRLYGWFRRAAGWNEEISSALRWRSTFLPGSKLSTAERRAALIATGLLDSPAEESSTASPAWSAACSRCRSHWCRWSTSTGSSSRAAPGYPNPGPAAGRRR